MKGSGGIFALLGVNEDVLLGLKRETVKTDLIFEERVETSL